jgi:hypothetical protein
MIWAPTRMISLRLLCKPVLLFQVSVRQSLPLPLLTDDSHAVLLALISTILLFLTPAI